MVEHQPLTLVVVGSSPTAPATKEETMDIKEIRKKKMTLENDILNLIIYFNNKTDMKVSNIEMAVSQTMGHYDIDQIRVDVEV